MVIMSIKLNDINDVIAQENIEHLEEELDYVNKIFLIQILVMMKNTVTIRVRQEFTRILHYISINKIMKLR